MSIDCINSGCVASCTRWTQVNEGEPIAIWHDTSGWDPTFYPNASNPDAQVYLDQALAVWEEAYDCGQLFTMVDTLAEADVRVIYEPEDPANPCFAVGTATCGCDDEDDVCVRQVDHSEIFGNAFGTLTMIYVECLTQGINNGLSENQWINVMVHELGHILGMGHVYNTPVDSVMGVRPDGSEIVQIFDFDRDQLDLRYPCDCAGVVTTPFRIWTGELFNSQCPGCLVSNYRES